MVYTSLLEAHKALGSHFPDYRKMARGWSNIAEDGSVVLSCWAHQFQSRGAALIFTNFEEHQPKWLRSPPPALWQRTPQNRKRIVHLRYAVDHNNSFVKVVVVTPTRLLVLDDLKNQNKTYEPRFDILMRIENVDWITGEFTASVLRYDLTTAANVEKAA